MPWTSGFATSRVQSLPNAIPLLGAIGGAVPTAVDVAQSAIRRLGDVVGTVGAETIDILERPTATSHKGNPHAALDGEQRLGPSQPYNL